MLAVQDSMPLRLHRVHFLHAPAFVENILNIFYPLLKERLVQKVLIFLQIESPRLISWSFVIFKFRVHTGGGEELYPYMDKEILPNEWGGRAGTFDQLNGFFSHPLYEINAPLHGV